MAGATLRLPYSIFQHACPLHEHLSWVLKQISRKTKSSQIFIVTHRDRGGIGTHYPGKWFVSVRVRTEERVQPLQSICQFPNLIKYHPQTLLYQQLVDNTMVLSTVG